MSNRTGSAASAHDATGLAPTAWPEMFLADPFGSILEQLGSVTFAAPIFFHIVHYAFM